MSDVAFDPNLTDDHVRLTDVAIEKMAELFDQTDDEVEAVRIFVSGGGCGGMNYGMTFTDARGDMDTVRDFEKFKIYIDTVALSYLKGVEIDYVDRPTGASFVFNNVFASTGGSGACSACGAAGGGCA